MKMSIQTLIAVEQTRWHCMYYLLCSNFKSILTKTTKLSSNSIFYYSLLFSKKFFETNIKNLSDPILFAISRLMREIVCLRMKEMSKIRR
jgi:hypothetical protein